jgi:hypothetical protein
MKVTFDVQSTLPEGMGQQIQSADLAELLGPEMRVVGERIDIGESNLDKAVERLRGLLHNPLITGVQATFIKTYERAD